MGRAAVTGSAGRVGAAIAAALKAAGWSVRGVDRAPGDHTDVVGDLRDPPIRRAALRDTDLLIHAAALHAPHVGKVDDREFQAVNVGMTEDLLADARRVIYISSTSVYGHALVPTDRAVWVDETLEPRPRDIYDETKLAAEQLIRSSPVPSAILRIARCFPEPPPLHATHRLHRSVSLTDVAAATTRAATHHNTTGTYNIAGPYPFTKNDCTPLHHDAATLITTRLPEIARAFAHRGWPLPPTVDRVYDSTAATRSFGYHPTRGIHALLSLPRG